MRLLRGFDLSRLYLCHDIEDVTRSQKSGGPATGNHKICNVDDLNASRFACPAPLTRKLADHPIRRCADEVA